MDVAHSASSAQAARLLEAAVQAAHAGESERSIELLRQSVAASHHNPLAHYLLGAELVHLQRHGDAVLHITTATEQAPTLWIARIQLGLLWLTLGNPGPAQAALQPLLQLPASDGLRLFGEGLLALAAHDRVLAASKLSSGLQAGVANPPLMADMQRLLQALDAPSTSGAAAVNEPAAVSHGMAISAYTGAGDRT